MKKNNTTSGCLTIFAAIVAIAVVIFFISASHTYADLGSFGIIQKYQYQKTKKVAYRSPTPNRSELAHSP